MHEFREGDVVEAIKNIDGVIWAGWQGTVMRVFDFDVLIAVKWPDLDRGHSLKGRLTGDEGHMGWNVSCHRVKLVSPREEPPIIEWWNA